MYVGTLPLHSDSILHAHSTSTVGPKSSLHERLETQVEAMQNDQQDVLQDRRLQLHNQAQITTDYYLIHQQESLT